MLVAAADASAVRGVRAHDVDIAGSSAELHFDPNLQLVDEP